MAALHSNASTPAARDAQAAGEALLWERWRAERDPEARAALLEMHLPYARQVAATYFGRRYHDEIEFDDYLQLARVGLIEAMERYDPSLGVQFSTFAARRMHGSIVDGLECSTEKQQQIAARQRLEAQRRESIRETSEDSSATPAARTHEQVLQYVAQAGLAFALSWLLDGTGLMDPQERAENLPFYRSIELRELRERILELVHALPAPQRRVIHGHYLQELPFEEIATRMALSRGRISQIHKAALLNLREALRGDGLCNILV
jgi:RNA polymerase sigma factor for flagellar operon FliA